MATVQEIARIINPYVWRQYDRSAKPYIENRGSIGDENFFYQITWKAGCRSVEDHHNWWLNTNYIQIEIFHWRKSLEKADIIIQAFDHRISGLIHANSDNVIRRRALAQFIRSNKRYFGKTLQHRADALLEEHRGR